MRAERCALTLFLLLRCPVMAGARPLWQDTVSIGGPDGQANDVVADHHAVFVGGFVTSLTFEVMLLRSYDARSGRLRWQDALDDPMADHEVRQLAVDGGRLFAAVFSSGPVDGGGSDWLVRAYDASGGGLLWQDRVDDGPLDEAVAAAASEGRVFAVGALDTGQPSFAVRAYQAANGTLVWEDRVPASGPADGARAVVAASGRVFALGDIAGTLALRAYDAASGALAWSASAAGPAGTIRLAAAGGRVFVAAVLDDGSTTLQARDAASGAALWQEDQATPGHAIVAELGLTASPSAVFSGTKVFVVRVPGAATSLVARDAGTGALVWRRGGTGVATALQLQGNALLAASGADGAQVAAFAVSDGAPLWQSDDDPEGSAVALAADGTLVFAAGVSGERFGTFHVAAFDRAAGLLTRIRRGTPALPHR
jgi:outer membrane protein assembly factor BamB